MKKLTFLVFGFSFMMTISLHAQYEVEKEEPNIQLLSNYEFASGKTINNKSMFKMTTSSGLLNNLKIGYEKKLGEYFSLGLDVIGNRFYSFSQGIELEDPNFIRERAYSLSSSLEGRFYFNQEELINQGYGSNLNGFYAMSGLRTTFYQTNREVLDFVPYFGVGAQTRILKYGLLDFRILAQIDGSVFRVYPSLTAGFAISKDYNLHETSGVRCNILRCYDEKSIQFKVPVNGLSSLTFLPGLDFIGLFVRPQLGVEHKLVKGFSLNHVMTGGFGFDMNFRNENAIRQSFSVFSYENNLRYYFLKRRNIAKGKSADNLSGVYAATQVSIGKTKYKVNNSSFNSFNFGVNLGYQARVFENFYFDVQAYLLRGKRNSTLNEVIIPIELENKYFTSYGLSFDFGILF